MLLGVETCRGVLAGRSAARWGVTSASFARSAPSCNALRARTALTPSRSFSSAGPSFSAQPNQPRGKPTTTNPRSDPTPEDPKNSQGKHEHPPTLRQIVWSLSFKLAWAAPVALFVVYHVVSLAQVQGGSMRPTFNTEVTELGETHAGDVVVLNKWTPGMRKYTAGDIVTLTDPDNPDLELTKRILALEDDVVAVHGVTHASDQRILAAVQESERKNGQTTAYVRVPPGHAWVEGDASLMDLNKAGPAQRDQSRDSRTYGPVRAAWQPPPPTLCGKDGLTL